MYQIGSDTPPSYQDSIGSTSLYKENEKENKTVIIITTIIIIIITIIIIIIYLLM